MGCLKWGQLNGDKSQGFHSSFTSSLSPTPTKEQCAIY